MVMRFNTNVRKLTSVYYLNKRDLLQNPVYFFLNVG